MIDPEFSNKTIFDLDFSSPEDPLYKFHQLVAANSLSMQASTMSSNTVLILNLLAFELFQDYYKREISKNFMQRCYKISNNNSFGISWFVASKDSKAHKLFWT